MLETILVVAWENCSPNDDPLHPIVYIFTHGFDNVNITLEKITQVPHAARKISLSYLRRSRVSYY